MDNKTVIFAGGGTGGHLYPAVAMAKAIEKKFLKTGSGKITIHFIGAKIGLESKVIPKEGYALSVLDLGGLSRVGLLQTIKTLAQVPIAIFKSIWLILKLKPSVVVGVGGYASGPFVLASWLMGVKTIIWEANSVPGLTNRWLGMVAGNIWTVFEGSNQFFPKDRVFNVGYPVRESIAQSKSQDLSRAQRTERIRSGGPLRVFIFGGSQGARGINNAIQEMMKFNPNIVNRLEVIHQTGQKENEAVESYYKNHIHPLLTKDQIQRIQVLPYIYDMDQKYQWADLVISRSGAGTVAELGSLQKACVLIPLPTSADDHQRKNALECVERNAAILLEQGPELYLRMNETLLDLLQHPEKLNELEHNMAFMNQLEAADKIADRIHRMINT